jgi:hypothetical protein
MHAQEEGLPAQLPHPWSLLSDVLLNLCICCCNDNCVKFCVTLNFFLLLNLYFFAAMTMYLVLCNEMLCDHEIE